MTSQTASFGKLENLALEYEEALVNEKKFSAIKKSLKIEIEKLLRTLKTDSIEVDTDSVKPLRVQKIFKQQIIYNIQKLKELLQSKGTVAFKQGFKITVNNKGLEDLYSAGTIEYEELQGCVEAINKKEQISVLRVKKDIKI